MYFIRIINIDNFSLFKFIIILFFFLFVFPPAISQNIDVKSFRVLLNDQSARVTDPVNDQNGEKCALIKVVTNQEGFAWEAGILGITNVEKKTGEYWVYVPFGSKKITIKHDKLGILWDYIYPEAIKKATVYEMILTTGTVKTIVEKEEIPSQWLTINSDPGETNVFINDNLAGKTPFQRKYKEGEYTYRLEKPRYHYKAGKITLKGEKENLELTLKPQFGNIRINSAPENGMQIFLDDNNTNKKTPATLEEIASGEHTLQLQSQWYQPKTKRVTVEDEQTADVNFTLEPAFANINVTAEPSAKILIDGQQKGTGTWSGRLMEGIYTIKAEKEKYYSQDQQLEVIAGQDKTLNFDLKGKTGNADIVTTPMEAEVYLYGEKKGTSPLTLNNLLIGEYNLSLEKEGYGIVTKTLTINENETVAIDEKLPEGKEVTIISKPTGSELYIDGINVGNTPKTFVLGFGKHTVKLINGEKVVEKQITLSQYGESRFEYDVTGSKGTFTDLRDGKKYKWVRIGTQIWMAENLNYYKRNGSWCYDNKSSNCEKYGRLYNWKTAKKVCPDGWHLPNDAEWTQLTDYLGGKNVAGGKLKEIGPTHWKSPNTGATNESGFTALPVGYRSDVIGYFDYVGYLSYWWSSTKYSSLYAWYRRLGWDYSSVGRHYFSKEGGFSVRCVRDY